MGGKTKSIKMYLKLHDILVKTVVKYEGDSKINLRLVGKKKHIVIAPNRTLSNNKQHFLSLNTYPYTFSLHSVGGITDETWTLSSLLPPAVRYML